MPPGSLCCIHSSSSLEVQLKRHVHSCLPSAPVLTQPGLVPASSEPPHHPVSCPSCAEGTALASAPYLPISPTCRSSEAGTKPWHVLPAPCRGSWHAVDVELGSMENDLCQGSHKLSSGSISLPRPQRRRGISVQERGPAGDRGTREGGGEVCMPWVRGGCLSIPSPHRDNNFCP